MPELAELQTQKDKITAIGKEIAHQHEEFQKSIKSLLDEQKRLQDEYASALRAELASVGAISRNSASPARVRAARGSNKVDEAAIIEVLEKAQIEISAADIKDRANITASSNSLSIALKRMVDSGAIVRIGERRASKYKIR